MTRPSLTVACASTRLPWHRQTQAPGMRHTPLVLMLCVCYSLRLRTTPYRGASPKSATRNSRVQQTSPCNCVMPVVYASSYWIVFHFTHIPKETSRLIPSKPLRHPLAEAHPCPCLVSIVLRPGSSLLTRRLPVTASTFTQPNATTTTTTTPNRKALRAH